MVARPGPDASVARLAARQHGAFTRSQAADAGLTRRQIDRRVAAGRYSVLRRGVLAVGGAPPTWSARLAPTPPSR